VFIPFFLWVPNYLSARLHVQLMAAQCGKNLTQSGTDVVSSGEYTFPKTVRLPLCIRV
jgi:hypothetical protein